MSKRILILGAGEAQLNLIKSAKRLGYHTIVCDMRPEMQGSKIANKYYQTNYMDKSVICDIARKERVDGVVSNSEPAMPTVSYLVDELGLPGNSAKSLANLISKPNFRMLQKSCGVFCPESHTSERLEAIIAFAETMSYPIILKPSESSGSRGAARIETFTEEEVSRAFRTCQDFSRNGQVTVEEFVEMESNKCVNADVFVAHGSILWDGWYGNVRSPNAPMIPMAKVLPPDITAERMADVKECVGRLLKASGVSLGEFNVETYYAKNGRLFVIEINPRQAGDNIPLLVQEHSGVDLTRLLVSLSVNDDSYYEYLKSYQRKRNHITEQVVFCDRDGIYQGLHVDDRIKPFVQWIEEKIPIGGVVHKARNAADCVAYVDLLFENIEQQRCLTSRIETLVYPIVR